MVHYSLLSIVKLFLSKHVISFRLQNQCEQVMSHNLWSMGNLRKEIVCEYLGHFHNENAKPQTRMALPK